MLDGFAQRRIATGDAELYVRIGGAGPPLVCLHGYPQSHLTWRKVGPALAERYTVVLPDLRGYGQSEIVASDAEHRAYSKRVMARDIVALMAALGWQRFFLAGHDRGGAYGAYHWQFLAQPEPLPERLIGSDPRWYCAQQMRAWHEDPRAVDAQALEAYCAAYARPGAVHAACEDYRAGYTCDDRADRADRDAGKRLAMPLLALWGARRDGRRSAHFPAAWERWATELSAQGLPCGHFMMEELPNETAAALRAFFDSNVGRLDERR